MGGGKFSKSLLCFGSIWKRASSALAKCLQGGRCDDVSCLKKRSGKRGLGLGKEQVAYSWASKDTCFPGDRLTVWKIVAILLNSTKGCSPGEVRTKGRGLWGECWRQELHGWSCRICVEEPWVLRRIHDDLTHTHKSQHWGAGPHRGHQRPSCYKSCCERLHQGLVSRRNLLLCCSIFPFSFPGRKK